MVTWRTNRMLAPRASGVNNLSLFNVHYKCACAQ